MDVASVVNKILLSFSPLLDREPLFFNRQSLVNHLLLDG